ncbi:hypothetical protein Tco_1517580 [Tanacetum coccineum]
MDDDGKKTLWWTEVINTVKIDEVRQIVDVESSGKSADEIDKETVSFGDMQLKQEDQSCVHASIELHLHVIHVVPNSQGKGVMVDDDVAPFAGASQPRPSSGPTHSFRNVSGDAIHTDFFPFSASPYYATYHVDGVARNYDFTREEWDAPYRPTFRVMTKEVFKDPAIYKTIVDQFLTPGEMVRVESLSDDQLTTKMSVMHYSRLKGYEEKVASLTGLELQVSALKKQVFGLNDKLSSSDASFTKYKEKGKERKKKIKSLTKSVDNLHFEGLVRKFLAFNEFSRVQGELLSLVASVGFKRGLSMHRTKDEFVLEPKKLVRPANVPALREVRVSLPPKGLIVTPDSKSLELSTNVNFTASDVASEHNEEMINVEVDGSNPKMADDTVTLKSGHAFMQGIYVALDDAVELVEVGSGRVSFGPNDVMVSLSAHEKGDGLDPSSVAGEEFVANPYGV